MTFMTTNTDEILRSESSDCVKLLLTLITHVSMRFTTHVDFKNGGLHATHNKMGNTRYFHGIIKWAMLMEAMMVTMLTLNTLTVMEVWIFRGKTTVKALNLRSYMYQLQ